MLRTSTPLSLFLPLSRGMAALQDAMSPLRAHDTCHQVSMIGYGVMNNSTTQDNFVYLTLGEC